MMHEPISPAEETSLLLPLGTCSMCGTLEDPIIAVFWRQDEYGSICPTCTGETPSEGYRHFVLVTRCDRGAELPMMHGPYSAGEAERVSKYLAALDNVKSAEVIPPEGK